MIYIRGGGGGGRRRRRRRRRDMGKEGYKAGCAIFPFFLFFFFFFLPFPYLAL